MLGGPDDVFRKLYSAFQSESTKDIEARFNKLISSAPEEIRPTLQAAKERIMEVHFMFLILMTEGNDLTTVDLDKIKSILKPVVDEKINLTQTMKEEDAKRIAKEEMEKTLYKKPTTKDQLADEIRDYVRRTRQGAKELKGKQGYEGLVHLCEEILRTLDEGAGLEGFLETSNEEEHITLRNQFKEILVMMGRL